MFDRIHSFGNIHQHLDLIAGLPYEDYDSFRHSFNDVYALKPQQLQLGFLKVLKGSHMMEMCREYGIVYKTQEPYEVLSTKWLDYDHVLKLKTVENMVEVYYNSGQFQNTLEYLENFSRMLSRFMRDWAAFTWKRAMVMFLIQECEDMRSCWNFLRMCRRFPWIR